MLVEDANTSKDIRGTIYRPLHLLDFLFSDEGFGGFSEPFSKGFPYCKTPGSQRGLDVYFELIYSQSTQA
ncbi:hypothetical protein CMV_021700 [Castanea mollissima]|uniref:Uncharacterized protein n=1 Tax=Castanea mollissima TaxID=60419 RepID=A0A8J4VLD5_9ROSI|nr:hypothetical protein CMV_021700 [Castanea mollissima]